MEMIKIDRNDDYATIRLSRPEKRNSINNLMLAEFEEALTAVESDKGVRALCLAGEGRHFCAGIDLAEGHRVAATEGGGRLSLESVFHHLEGLSIPTVAAVQGAALAGGCELALHCDLRIAAEILKGKKVHPRVRTIVIPGTQQIYLDAMHEGLLETFINAGAVVSTPTCGPCLGGYMGILAAGEKAISTTNRNFVGRMGSTKSEVYLANPAVAAASAITGRISSPEELTR